MHSAICQVSIAPIRRSASNRSEQVSQLLFGELVEILETKGRRWTKVCCLHDHTIGWVSTGQLMPLTSKEFERFTNHFSFVLDLVHPMHTPDSMMLVTLGARLPDFDGLCFLLGGRQHQYTGIAVEPGNINHLQLLKMARKFLNAPHQWGGRSPLGVDAAGLVQLVYSLVGIDLPREASRQVHFGTVVDFVEMALPGDLAFFENKNGHIAHVGLVTNPGYILHCGEKVREDLLDHFGIFNREQKRYTHRLRVIKRLLSVEDSTTLANRMQALEDPLSETQSSPHQLAIFD
ncbi:MAG: hydrolase Nlp/P60 [Saprospiraceae bacterium]|nr:MAG: hydrolase Nlp/P60 [Saprospiraceae bacterium]